MKNKFSFFSLQMFFILLFAGHVFGSPIDVVVSIAPQKWLVEQIGGNLVSTSILIGKGQDPHSFQPRPKQIADLSKARIYFTVDMPFEKVIAKKVSHLKTGPKIIDISQNIHKIPISDHDRQHGHHQTEEHHEHGEPHSDHEKKGDEQDHELHQKEDHHEHGESHADHDQKRDHKDHDLHQKEDHHEHGESKSGHKQKEDEQDHEVHEKEDHHEHEATETLDPHIWLSPDLLKHMGETIADVLMKEDPGNRKQYQNNLDKLSKKLDNLHTAIKKKLSPFAGSSFYVFHPSFGYFTNTYRLKQEAIETEGKSPTPRQLQALIQKARSEGAKIIFVQPQFDRNSALAIASAINGQVVPLDPLAEDVGSNLVKIADKIAEALSM